MSQLLARASKRRTAILEGLCAGFFFGSAAVFIRLLPALNALSIAIGRLVVASILLIVLSASLRIPFRLNALRANLRRISLLGLLLGSHFVLFVSSVKSTSILNATVLVSTTPVMAMVVSSIMFKMKPSKTALYGLAISFLGVIIIVYGDATGSLSSSIGGDVEAVLASLAEAFYLNYGRDLRMRYNPMTMMPMVYLAATIPIVCASLLTNMPLSLPVGLDATLVLLGLGIIPTALAHTLYFSSLSGLKSFETATLALLEPIGATLLGIVLFQEIPGVLFMAGAVILLTGVIVVLKQ